MSRFLTGQLSCLTLTNLGAFLHGITSRIPVLSWIKWPLILMSTEYSQLESFHMSCRLCMLYWHTWSFWQSSHHANCMPVLPVKAVLSWHVIFVNGLKWLLTNELYKIDMLSDMKISQSGTYPCLPGQHWLTNWYHLIWAHQAGCH